MGARIASKIIAWGGRFLSRLFAMYDKEILVADVLQMSCNCVTWDLG